ncbi:MAG: aldo/keto reductase, partial [Chloroflexi bacterium]|nr:aldo/keto reductase [Chloroflexota bacterium]
MLYRKFGKLDWKGSALGFGAMRLPVIDRNEAKIDEPEAIRMIRYAIDCGVNYVDTGYMYHSGNSEIVVGKALKEGYRDKIKLATKLPARNIKTSGEFDRIFNEQLERLQTMKIDFYLLHGLNAKSWARVRDLGVMHWAESMIAKGHID